MDKVAPHGHENMNVLMDIKMVSVSISVCIYEKEWICMI